MSKFLNDVFGGVTASLVLLPRNMAFGLLIFLPFGPEYASLGIAAGIMSLLIANGISAYLGSVPVMTVSTFSLSALLMMSMNVYLMDTLPEIGVTDPAPTAMLFCFLATLFAGFFQLCFGVLKLGNLAKYIPYPVLAGLLNGTAIAIVLAQFDVIVMGNQPSGYDVHVFALLTVATITIISAVAGQRLVPRIPSVFFGLFFGTLAYYLIERIYFEPGLGEVVGALPGNFPLPRFVDDLYALLLNPESQTILGTVILFAIGIGAADTMRAALSCLIVDLKTGVRSDFNKELIGEGLGNMIAALFGSITSTGNATGALSNHSHGGTTSLSRLVVGISILLILMYLDFAVEIMPMAVLAAVMIVMTVTIMDFQFIGDLQQSFRRGFEKRSQVGINLILELTVAILVVLVDLFVALAFGLVVSVALFVMRMSKQIVRSTYRGTELPSNVLRVRAEQAFLEEHSDQIRVLELEGVLYFGTADKLHDHLDPLLAAKVDVIILDLKLVTEIDRTAVDILIQCSDKCTADGRRFAVSSLTEQRARARFPDLMYAIHTGAIKTFGSTSDALEWAERHILEIELGQRFSETEVDIGDISVLRNMSEGAIKTLQQHLTPIDFNAGDYLIRQGMSDRVVYFIVSGEAIIGTRQGTGFLRFSTVRAGTVVGEMSLFDESQRSADVVAVTDTRCYALTSDELQKLKVAAPEVAYEFVVGLNAVNAERLRNANSIISKLR